MIGSVSELQQQLAEQERRRQQAAAQQLATPADPAAVPLSAPVTAAGYDPAPAALKSARPGKDGLIGRDLERDPESASDRKRRLPSVPKPGEDHIRWAKRVLADGYQASVKDRVDAGRILDAAGLDADDFHAGREPDSAPPGAREIAAAHLERERAESDRSARKSFRDRGAEPGPGEGAEPGHPQPADYDRPYVSDGHASRSPQAAGPRTNPLPQMEHRILPDQPRAAAIPPAVIDHFTMGSPSDK